jgi:hypothetical protein
MQRPRIRFTIRRLLVVVAIVAIILAIGGVLNRSRQYRRIAQYHRAEAERAAARQAIAIGKATVDEQFGDRADASRRRLLAESIGRVASFHTEFGWKYSRAPRRPWQLAGPDPVPPSRP